ncbi:MAG: hemolysin family protein, partial [Thermodesulfobacteriota bacterium]
STVQIGITLVGIIAGAFSGATLGHRLGGWLDAIPAISPHGTAVGIGLTVLATTYLSLIIGELVPKRIAFAQPERIAILVAGPMLGLSTISAPAVWVLHASTEMILSVFGLSGSRETTVTEEEIKTLIAEGTMAGVFVPQEQKMIEGILRMADRSVRIIMTPRSQIVWINAESDWRTILDTVDANRFSRLLVCDGTVDRPVGFVHSKDLLPAALRGGDFNLKTLVQPLLFVPDKTSVRRLLNRLKSEKVHIAVVVDEYGATEGLVTITDVIEAIAGNLPERGEESEPLIVRREDGSWLVDGMLPTDEVETVTGIGLGEEVKTMAGFVLQHLRRIPESGASFRYGNARFEVVDMDGRRIDKVLVTTEHNGTESHELSKA